MKGKVRNLMAKSKKDRYALIHKLRLQLKRDFPEPFCIYAGWELLDLVCEFKSNPDNLPEIKTFYINPVEFEGYILTDKPDKIYEPEGKIDPEMLVDIHNYYSKFDSMNIIFYVYNDYFIRFNLDNISI